ncbi:protein FAM161A isoform X2 [Ischnura elegans]|nr:protein FAM161A isoform X2 [Ischnura elegans]
MPTSNSDSSFTHSCIKVPINPSSGLPSPSYERENDALLVMNSRKDVVVSAYGPILSSPSIPRTKLSKLSPNIKSCDSARPLKAFIDFYESIPDYGDLNHLSDEDFYRKIQHLKEKQKQYSSSLTSQCVEDDIKDAKPESRSKEVSSVGSNPCSDLHSGIVGVNCLDNRVKEKCTSSFKTRKQFVSNTSSQTFAKSRFESPKRCKVKKHHSSLEVSTSEESTVESIDNGKIHTENDDNTVSENDGFGSKMSLKKATDNNPPPQKTPHKKQQKELLNLSRDSSSKSTRKNHPQVRVSSGSLVDSAWDNFSIDDYYPKSGHSFSDSDSNLDLRCSDCPPPRQIKSVAWKDPKITVPVPFNMVSREKENREICQLRGELYGSKRDLSKSESKGFKTKPVPIESRIPLYDKILNEQETRRRMVKKQSMENLKAMMKPFSFVKRDEEEKRYLVTHSSPELRNISKPMKLFKAKPVPRNLFSSHVYQRMREDEFYRTLRKRIRSEELLRSSSLPPSMAAREKANLRRERFSMDEDKVERCCRPKRKRSKIPNYKLSHDILRMELEGRKNENITTTPQPFHLETAMIHDKKG